MQNKNLFQFCPSCGGREIWFENERRWHCGACDFTLYFNVASAVAVLIRSDDDLLLVERAREPGKGLLDLPGGFVDPGEGLEDAVRREVMEELGLALEGMTYLTSLANPYPYRGVDYVTADACFLAEVAGRPTLTPADDVAAAHWCRVQEVRLEALAFDSVRHFVSLIQGQAGRS